MLPGVARGTLSSGRGCGGGYLRARAAQQEREGVTLLGGQRRGGIYEALDVGIQVCFAARVRWGLAVAAVTGLRGRAGARPTCHPRLGLRLRC